MTPRSGEQICLHHGDQEVTVTQVGATLRSYQLSGRDVIAGFDADEVSPVGRGQVLAPWPNRLGRGQYSFGGRTGHAALDEPDRSNAIHGLVRWLGWDIVDTTVSAASLVCLLRAQPAYPWQLRIRITYRLGTDGLAVTTEVTNESDDVAPFGLGFHPYLTLGRTVDDLLLQVAASKRLLTDDCALPVGGEPIDGTAFDFREPRPIGGTQLDTAFGDLELGRGGRTVARLSTADGGRGVCVWVDSTFRWLMVFTGDSLPEAQQPRQAVAIEPMTCPPDAFNSGVDVIKLHPWTSWSATWGITPEVGAR